MGFPHSSVGKESACNAGDPGSIPGSGRSPREGIGYPLQYSWDSLVAQLVNNLPAMQETWVQCKQSACNAGDLGSILWSGRCPGEGKGSPLQYSGLENSMDCPWGQQSWTQLSDFHFQSPHLSYHPAGKAAHFSIFIWSLANLT